MEHRHAFCCIIKDTFSRFLRYAAGRNYFVEESQSSSSYNLWHLNTHMHACTVRLLMLTRTEEKKEKKEEEEGNFLFILKVIQKPVMYARTYYTVCFFGSPQFALLTGKLGRKKFQSGTLCLPSFYITKLGGS